MVTIVKYSRKDAAMVILESQFLYHLDIFKNLLTSFPIYMKITNQIKEVEAQAFFLLIKDKAIMAVIP